MRESFRLEEVKFDLHYSANFGMGMLYDDFEPVTDIKKT